MTDVKAPTRPLNLAIIGAGLGGTATMPAIEHMEEINLVACADVNPVMRERFSARFTNSRVYASAEEVCSDPDVEAVWVSTPNRFHAEHTIMAANHGKHVVVEKPMAVNLAQAEQMVKACADNGVTLIAGHTNSYSSAISAMRRIITSGRLGRVTAITDISYTDWMLRPRNLDELDLAQGGGVPFRQGPHQVDQSRLLGGGMVRSLRGTSGQWASERPIPGYYGAYLEFEDGTPAVLVHNGHGYFLANELVPWGGPEQTYSVEQRVAIRQQMKAGLRDEQVAKNQRHEERTEGQFEEEAHPERRVRRPWQPQDPGLLIVSCEHGDIRHSKFGLYVYDDDGLHDIEIEESAGVGRRELTELYDAVVNGEPVYHSGAWAMATLEVCLALMQSGDERREIYFAHQVPVVDHPDSFVHVPYLDD